MVKYLDEQGANLEHREILLRTPLYFAASMGCVDIIHYLVERGCNVDVPSNLGRTALGKACWNGAVDVVEMLLKFNKIDIDYHDSN
jgi:ankyrin repeat protein